MTQTVRFLTLSCIALFTLQTYGLSSSVQLTLANLKQVYGQLFKITVSRSGPRQIEFTVDVDIDKMSYRVGSYQYSQMFIYSGDELIISHTAKHKLKVSPNEDRKPDDASICKFTFKVHKRYLSSSKVYFGITEISGDYSYWFRLSDFATIGE